MSESDAGTRVATSVRGWGTLTGERTPGGDVFVLFDGADYAIPFAAGGVTAGPRIAEVQRPGPAAHDSTASPEAAASSGRDIYESPLAREQLADDALDYRRSLYTNTKADHPANHLTGEPCDCEAGGTYWETKGIAMRAQWPPLPQYAAPTPDLEAGQ